MKISVTFTDRWVRLLLLDFCDSFGAKVDVESEEVVPSHGHGVHLVRVGAEGLGGAVRELQHVLVHSNFLEISNSVWSYVGMPT